MCNEFFKKNILGYNIFYSVMAYAITFTAELTTVRVHSSHLRNSKYEPCPTTIKYCCPLESCLICNKKTFVNLNITKVFHQHFLVQVLALQGGVVALD